MSNDQQSSSRRNQWAQPNFSCFATLHQRWPSWTILCFGLSYCGRRICQDHTCSRRQAQTWPTCPPARIVQDASACAEIGLFFSVLWCTDDNPLCQCSICCKIVTNELHIPQTSTISLSMTVINSVLLLVSIGLLVPTIWPFPQVLGCMFVHVLHVFACMCHFGTGMYVQVCVCMCMCAYVCVCLCMFVYVYDPYLQVLHGRPFKHGSHHHAPKIQFRGPQRHLGWSRLLLQVQEHHLLTLLAFFMSLCQLQCKIISHSESVTGSDVRRSSSHSRCSGTHSKSVCRYAQESRGMWMYVHVHVYACMCLYVHKSIWTGYVIWEEKIIQDKYIWMSVYVHVLACICMYYMYA
jgi:hypothetical protein